MSTWAAPSACGAGHPPQSAKLLSGPSTSALMGFPTRNCKKLSGFSLNAICAPSCRQLFLVALLLSVASLGQSNGSVNTGHPISELYLSNGLEAFSSCLFLSTRTISLNLRRKAAI